MKNSQNIPEEAVFKMGTAIWPGNLVYQKTSLIPNSRLKASMRK
jgi:hypothetical protein